MRKTIILAVLALMSSTAVFAQERMSEEERAKAISERIGKAADRMAGDFKLKDDAKKSFVETYTAYQKEMFATNQMQGQRLQRDDRDGEKKELTDEEAQARIKENFERQEKQIQTMQKRLEVQKKYAEEFGKVLTPKQVLKVLNPERRGNNREQGQQRGQGNGERRGGFGEGGPRGGFGGGPRGGFGGGF
ncbi:MAG: hypothetical protein IJ537_03230 [Bacteroidaceae bacterium]|nr:hypothetical protein [Bacteroidaceae bacterium]MBQ8454343.1 hypothetical protein [Bacteroidaceae bacterium]MBQ9171404.1 hypothetical protein [Bacteroidaceae bacterium]